VETAADIARGTVLGFWLAVSQRDFDRAQRFLDSLKELVADLQSAIDKIKTIDHRPPGCTCPVGAPAADKHYEGCPYRRE
jgi:hypothetical protein